MTYQLIRTSEAAQARLLRDVACSQEHRVAVSSACKLNRFPSHWALEAETCNYLVGLLHEDLRPENLAERYAFSFDGALFDVQLDSIFGSVVTIAPLCGAVIDDVPVFRVQLTLAFVAHGRHGRPDYMTALVPEFID